MPNRVRSVTVTDADRVNLDRMARDRGAPARVAERARIVLLSAEGLSGRRSRSGSLTRSADISGDLTYVGTRRSSA